MIWRRALWVWLLIVAAESIHGGVREMFLAPMLGDLRARQFGVLTGSLIILAIAWASIRWIGASSFAQQLRVGLLWVILIVGFEVGLGVALGYSRERILSDYDFRAGGFMGLGLLVLLFAPVLAARMRGIGSGKQARPGD